MNRMFYALLLLLPLAASAADFSKVQADKSSVTFVSKQMSVPVEGAFKKFSADVHINPAKPEKGSAKVEIDLAGIDAGGEEANDEVKGKAWFDVAAYPKASFVLTSIKAQGGGKYEAAGKLSLKGKTADIHVPCTMKEEKGVLGIDGGFVLKRLDYGIGSGSWGDTSVVADEVQVKFHLVVK